MAKKPHPKVAEKNARQQLAIALLADGKDYSEVAAALKVREAQIKRWFTEDPEFQSKVLEGSKKAIRKLLPLTVAQLKRWLVGDKDSMAKFAAQQILEANDITKKRGQSTHVNSDKTVVVTAPLDAPMRTQEERPEVDEARLLSEEADRLGIWND